MSSQLRLKFFVEVEGKVLLKIVNQDTTLEELRAEIYSGDWSTVSLTYFYEEAYVSLDTEGDLEALKVLASLDKVTTFKAAAHVAHAVDDSAQKKKRKSEEHPAARERRLAASEQLRKEREALGIVVKRGRPLGSRNKVKTDGTSGVSGVNGTPSAGDANRSIDYSEEGED